MAISTSVSHIPVSDVNAATTSGSIAITAGTLILVWMSMEHGGAGGLDDTTPLTNSGAALTWTKVADTHTGSDSNRCRVALYRAIGDSSRSLTFTHTRNGSGLTFARRMTVEVHTGQHGTTPLPAGNVFVQTTNVANVSRTVTPAGAGSRLAGIAADWNQVNAYSALANNTISVSDVPGRFTTAYITPTTNPLASGSNFTQGANCSGGANVFIMVEVVPAAGGSSYNESASFSTTATMTPTSNLNAQSTAAVAATAALTVAGIFNAQSTASVSAVLAHVASGLLTRQGSVSFSSAMALTLANFLSVPGVVQVSVSAVLAGLSQLNAQNVVSISGSPILVTQGNINYQNAASIVASTLGLSVASVNAAVASLSMAATAAMLNSSLMNTSGSSSFNVSPLLQAQDALESSTYEVSCAIAAMVAHTVSANLQVAGSLSLAADVEYTALGGFVVTSNVTLSADVEMGVSSLAIYGSQLSFSAQFDQEASANFSTSEAADFSTSLALSVFGSLSSEEIEALTLEGTRELTINLEGKIFRDVELSGTITLTIGLEGRIIN